MPFKWTEVHETSFREIKKIIARETLLSFPDFNKPFEIHTDASKIQLGGIISQNGKPIAFYSRKLNPAQTRYTTTERELLSIVETLKEFRNILLGQEIVIHTDHQNLIHNSFTSDRVMRWRLYLEEYSPQIKYIKGEENATADAISRLPKMINQMEIIHVPDIKEFLTVEEMSDLFYYDQLIKEKELITTPINYEEIEKHQRIDEILKQMLHTPHTELEM